MLTEHSLDHCWMRRRVFLANSSLGVLSACAEGGSSKAEGARVSEEASAEIAAGYSTRQVPLPLRRSGAPVRLRFAFQRPTGPGPHPLVVMHHGSTGRGDNPALFPHLSFPEDFARVFAGSGYLVAAPQRRGRGGSEGTYAEGLSGGRYSNETHIAEAGYERAMEDAQAALTWLLERPEVDPSRVLLAGQSRGGILALGQAARTPPQGLRGAINFVGGWLGEGFDPAWLNRRLFAAAGRTAVPSLSLYGERDPYYSIPFSRQNFEAYIGAGGKGSMEVLAVPPGSPGATGHRILFFPEVWHQSVDRFIGSLGLPPLGAATNARDR
jgi:dienelactone hydrolase